MATPYFQIRREEVASTQDVAREELGELPVLVMASSQSEGRGRTGRAWLTAPRALAASLALTIGVEDMRPFSLMAGVAAMRATEGCLLKWPNDVMLGDRKAGGILVERSESTLVIGVGLNLWWPDPPEEMIGLLEEDPGPDRHAEIGALWGAELIRIIGDEGWPHAEYQSACRTIGRSISWSPDGSGRAVGVDADGGLVVETSQGVEVLRSGEVSEVRA